MIERENGLKGKGTTSLILAASFALTWIVHRNLLQVTVAEATLLPKNRASTHCHRREKGTFLKDAMGEVCESYKTVGLYKSY